jgi:hypothetical protein
LSGATLCAATTRRTPSSGEEPTSTSASRRRTPSSTTPWLVQPLATAWRCSTTCTNVPTMWQRSHFTRIDILRSFESAKFLRQNIYGCVKVSKTKRASPAVKKIASAQTAQFLNQSFLSEQEVQIQFPNTEVPHIEFFRWCRTSKTRVSDCKIVKQTLMRQNFQTLKYLRSSFLAV